MVDFLITLFLGYLGVHKFKQGKKGLGFLYLFTFGLFGIGWIVDVIVAARNLFTRPLTIASNQSSPAQSNASVSSALPRTGKKEHHRIAGTSYRQKEILSLGCVNPDFSLTKKELIDNNLEGTTIYNYTFSPSNIELVEEPDNEYDPNAVKVIIDGVHIGYIKKGSCSHVKNLIRSGKIQKIEATIRGGKSRLLYSEYDDEKNKDVFRLETDSSDFFVSIDIYTE